MSRHYNDDERKKNAVSVSELLERNQKEKTCNTTSHNTHTISNPQETTQAPEKLGGDTLHNTTETSVEAVVDTNTSDTIVGVGTPATHNPVNSANIGNNEDNVGNGSTVPSDPTVDNDNNKNKAHSVGNDNSINTTAINTETKTSTNTNAGASGSPADKTSRMVNTLEDTQNPNENEAEHDEAATTTTTGTPPQNNTSGDNENTGQQQRNTPDENFFAHTDTTCDNMSTKHASQKGAGDHRTENPPPESPIKINNMTPHKKQKRVTDNPVATQFDKVKPDFSKLTNGAEVVDKEQQRKKLGRITAGVFAALCVAGMTIFTVNHINELSNPPQHDTPPSIEQTNGGNPLYELATKNNPEVEAQWFSGELKTSVDGNLIRSTTTPETLSFGAYKLDNTNECDMERHTDMCYLAEVKTPTGETVARVYSFANIYKTQFFKDYTNFQQTVINTAPHSGVLSGTLAGENRTSVIIGDSSGVGYMITFINNDHINKVTEQLTYTPT